MASRAPQRAPPESRRLSGGHGCGPAAAAFPADPGPPRGPPVCSTPFLRAHAMRPAGASGSEGRRPGQGPGYTRGVKALQRSLAQLRLAPRCGPRVCAGDSIFFSSTLPGPAAHPQAEGQGAGYWGPRPPAESRRRSGETGCPGRHLLEAYYVLPVCSAPALPNCITKHHKPESVWLFESHRALGVCVCVFLRARHWIWV